jgi:predicted transposase YbfD/YdcC
VFAALDPAAFETCFLNWTAQLAKASEGKLVAIDGKTLRRSFDAASKQSAIHMISAFCQQNHLVLGQLTVEAKTNEITALPKLLKLLDLNGATVTVDAMHCQKSTAKAIRKAGGDYLMQVKMNQKSLHEDIELFFDEAIEHGWRHTGYAFDETIEKDHGRIETRRCWSTWEVDWLNQRFNWPELSSIVCVEAKREVAGQASTERRYYLSSHNGRDAAALLAASRGHWAIENSLHWSLDVSFGEDQSRLRQGHAAENFARLRRLALNLLKKDKTHKIGLKAKAKACGWDHDYLLKVLTQP